VTGQENALTDVAEPIPAIGSAVGIVRVPQSLPAAPATPDPLQTLFLRRLTRLVHQESEWHDRVGPDDWRIKLIQRAIYSTYCDCATSEDAESARDLLHNRRYNP
jgi:hypothetical protein